MRLVFRVERLSEIKDEVLPLIAAHHEEIEQSTIPLDPDWETYETLEEQGMYLAITARCGQTFALAGYAGFYLLPRMPHSKDRSLAQSDVFYIKPEARKGINGVRMLRFADSVLFGDMAYTHVALSCKVNHSTEALFRRLGYRPIEATFLKGVD